MSGGTVTTAATGRTADLEYKAAAGPATASGLLSAEDATGVVEAIVSVTGVVDDVDDVIEPGAYAKTLQRRTPKGVFGHDWHKWVARTEEIAELLPGDPRLPKETKDGKPWPGEAGGLYVKAKFNLATTQGADAYHNVKFFSETGECDWSIGYKVPRGGATRDTKSGVRRITDLDLYEFSPVLFGAAGSFSGTVSVKSSGAETPAGGPDGSGGGNPSGATPDGPQEGAEPPDGDVPGGPTPGEEQPDGPPPVDPAQPVDPAETTPAGDGPDWAALDEAAERLLSGAPLPDGDNEAGTEAGTDTGTDTGTEEKRFVPAAKRHAMAKEGTAMDDGSYPIETEEDLKNAIQAFGRAKDKAATKAHIIKRARAMGKTNLLPDGWTGNAPSGKTADGGDGGLETKMAHEPLNRSPRKNWVENAGELPAYIQHIARDIHEQKGLPLSAAIPTAIAAVKRWAAGGGNVNADTRAKAAQAVAEWEALKAKSHARSAARSDAHATKSLPATLDDVLDGWDPAPEAFAGTFEELRDLLAAKAAEALDDGPDGDGDGEFLVDVIGTWPDRFIATRFPMDGMAGKAAESFEFGYTADSAGVHLGDPEPVEVTVAGADGVEEKATGLLPFAATIDDVVTGVKSHLLAASSEGDHPDDGAGDGGDGVETKAGRVLSGANAERIKASVKALISVLEAAGVQIVDDEGDDAGTGSSAAADAGITPDSTAPATQVKTAAGGLLPDPAAIARGYRILADAL